MTPINAVGTVQVCSAVEGQKGVFHHRCPTQNNWVCNMKPDSICSILATLQFADFFSLWEWPILCHAESGLGHAILHIMSDRWILLHDLQCQLLILQHHLVDNTVFRQLYKSITTFFQRPVSARPCVIQNHWSAEADFLLHTVLQCRIFSFLHFQSPIIGTEVSPVNIFMKYHGIVSITTLLVSCLGDCLPVIWIL
jgi:hypothetical protein